MHKSWRWQLMAAMIGFGCTGLFIGYCFLFLYVADAQGKDMPPGEEVATMSNATLPFWLVVLICCAGPLPFCLSKPTNPRVEDGTDTEIHWCTPCACFTATALIIFCVQMASSNGQLAEYHRLENTLVVEGIPVANVGLHAPNSAFRFVDGVVATSLQRSMVDTVEANGVYRSKRYTLAPVFTSEGCYVEGRQLLEERERRVLAGCQVAFVVAAPETTEFRTWDFACKGNDTGTEYPLCVSPGTVQGCNCAQIGGCTDCQPLGACEAMMTELELRPLSVCSAPWYLPMDFTPRLAQVELSTNAMLETLWLWAGVAAGFIFFQYAWGAWITALCPRLAPADDSCNGCGLHAVCEPCCGRASCGGQDDRV